MWAVGPRAPPGARWRRGQGGATVGAGRDGGQGRRRAVGRGAGRHPRAGAAVPHGDRVWRGRTPRQDPRAGRSRRGGRDDPSAGAVRDDRRRAGAPVLPPGRPRIRGGLAREGVEPHLLSRAAGARGEPASPGHGAPRAASPPAPGGGGPSHAHWEARRPSVGRAVPPAIPVARAKGEELPSEELRLKYRHLDLRRPEMQANLVLRHRLLQRARRTLSELEFLEIETPILTKPTPEGARDYLVPSRVHPGEFYALPQSPQIYKQLLMVAGFDRYFQIEPRFRDEDLRNDRQPEFTQIDIEASFVGMEDVLGFVETVLAALWEEGGHPVARPFPRITWREAMERYGTDKPDLRYELAIADWTTQVAGLRVPFFQSALQNGARVRGLAVKGDRKSVV